MVALQEFSFIIKQQAAFFAKAKRAEEPKFNDIAATDEKISYFNETLKGQSLCFPYLNRVHGQTLVLRSKVLNEGLCNALKAVLNLMTHLLSHLYLDSNSLSGPLLYKILAGLQMQ